MLKPGLSTIVARSGIGNTPARVHMATGRMEVNAETWWSIPAPYRQFIILHEAGHRKLATSSEFEADNYALQGMLAMGHRPDTCVDALRSVLSFTTPEHYARVRAMQGKIAPSMAVPGSTFSNSRNMDYNAQSPVMQSFAGTYETFIPEIAGDILKGAKKGVETLSAQRQAKIASGQEVKGGIFNLLDKVGQGKGAGKVPSPSNGGPKGKIAAEAAAKEASNVAGNSNKKVFMYVGIGVAVVVVIGAIAYFATR